VIKPVKAQPDARRDDKVALFFRGAFLSITIRELFERTMQAQIKGHAHSMAAWQPTVRAPRSEE